MIRDFSNETADHRPTKRKLIVNILSIFCQHLVNIMSVSFNIVKFCQYFVKRLLIFYKYFVKRLSIFYKYFVKTFVNFVVYLMTSFVLLRPSLKTIRSKI